MKFWPWIYGFQCGDFIKVGIAGNVEARLYTARLYNPHPVKVVFRERHMHARRVEIRMHQLLNDCAMGREWFDVPPKAIRLAWKVAIEDVAVWEREQAEWERESLLKSQKCGRNVENPET